MKKHLFDVLPIDSKPNSKLIGKWIRIAVIGTLAGVTALAITAMTRGGHRVDGKTGKAGGKEPSALQGAGLPWDNKAPGLRHG